MEQTRKTTILFLSADPSDATRLRLGQEQREIHEKLQFASMRDMFSLEIRTSVRPGDMIQALHDTKPRIVHFSGHGTEDGEICLEDDSGRIHPVHSEALKSLFELVTNYVECVVLNACYSEIQAKAIVKHIDYVVGMNQAIGDDAAIAFSVGFYRALGAGRNIDDAFKFGVVELRLLNISEHLTPVIIKRRKHSERSSNPPGRVSSNIGDIHEEHRTQITILLEKDLESFTSSEQEIFVFAISRLASIPPEQIRILKVLSGSVNILMELPEEAGHKLVEMAINFDPLLRNLRIKEISFYHLSIPIESRQKILEIGNSLGAEESSPYDPTTPRINIGSTLQESTYFSSDISEFLRYLATHEEVENGLPSLNELSRELGIGVAALREQLEVARALGLVEVKPRMGTRRREYSFTPAVRQSLGYALTLNNEHFRKYFDLRNHVESAFWYEAVQKLTESDKQELQALVTHAWEKLRGTPIQVPHEEHRNLHLKIYSRLENPFVTGILEAYWDAYEAVGLNVFAGGYDYLKEVWQYHQIMVEAIFEGNYKDGYDALINHTDLLYQRP